jgi:hypothetical protein
MTQDQYTWMKGNLPEKEYRELLGLEYILTWGYTNNIDADEQRYKQLSDKKWQYRDENPFPKTS